jgi:putative Mg2+ transporter-C (MgtC) family protein
MELNNDMVIKVMLAILVGGTIGIERELRIKSAGFRTLMLICLGATLFTIFSQFIGAHTSPDRIASNVVVGIGFIGAGVIYKQSNRINGITTAASIWAAAALGVGIGCGAYGLSILGCVIVVAILFLFSFFDDVIDRMNQLREYRISFPHDGQDYGIYEELMKSCGLSVKNRAYTKAGNIFTGNWVVRGNEQKHHNFIEKVLKDNRVIEFVF